MPDNYTLGLDCKLYYGADLFDETHGAAERLPTMTEADNVKDLTLNLEKAEADISTRANEGWRTKVATLKDGSIEFQMVWKRGDSFFEALLDSFMNNTEVPMVALDGDKDDNDVQGLAANWNVFNFTRNENLEEAVMVDVSCAPSSFPEWYDSDPS